MGRGPINLIGHTGIVNSTVFTPDSRRLVSGAGDATIKIWNVERAQEEATLRGHRISVSSLAISGDGLRLASGSNDFTAKLWNLSSMTELTTFQGHTEGVFSVALSADASVLVSASTDRTARIWDPNSGTELAKLDHPYPVRSLALTPDGKVLITCCDLKYIGSPPTSFLTFWDVQRRRQIGVVSGAIIRWSLGLTGDGTQLAIGLSEGDFDSNPPHLHNMVELWDVAAQRINVRWEAHDNEITSLSFSGNGHHLATGSLDTKVKLWNVSNQHLEAELNDQTHWVWSVAMSKDGRWLASGGGLSPSTAELHLWEMSGRGQQTKKGKKKSTS